MTTRWHIGARELRGAIAAYAKRFDLLEVRLAPPAPSVATLRRWRKAVPPYFDFAVVAGPHLSLGKPGAATDLDIAAAQEAVDALQARCLVLRTVPEVSPAPIWRSRIERLLPHLRRDATHLIWEPSGLWEAEDARAQARAWGVVCAVDPLREPVPAGPVTYLRLRALGETRTLGEPALERIAHAVGSRRDAYVVLETDSAVTEAQRLRKLARATKPNAPGSRMLPSSGGIVVRDDEQE